MRSCVQLYLFHPQPWEPPGVLRSDRTLELLVMSCLQLCFSVLQQLILGAEPIQFVLTHTASQQQYAAVHTISQQQYAHHLTTAVCTASQQYT